MSFTQKILIPLTDHIDTSFIEHKNIFESEGDRIALKTTGDDEFGSETEQDIASGGDGAKSYDWNVLNTASVDAIDVHTTNAGKITFDLNNVNSEWEASIATGPYVYKDIYDGFDVEINFSDNADQIYEKTGILVRDPTVSGGEDWLHLFRQWQSPSTAIYFAKNTNSVVDYTKTIVSSDTFLRLVRTGDLFTAYHKTNSGDGWSLLGSWSRADFADSIQVGIATATVNTNDTFVSQIDYFRFNSGGLYPTSSPSPGAAWYPTGGPCTVKVKKAANHRFKNGVIIEDLSGFGDDLVVKYKNAVDGGSLGTSRALSAFRNQGDIEVTSSPESSQSITGITRLGNVATVNKGVHGYVTGDGIIQEGSDQDEYNGPKPGIIRIDDDNYTFNVKGSPTTPATGTMTAKRHNAFKIVAVYVSDGTKESKSSARMEVDVIFLGNGGGLLTHPGMSGGMRG